MIILTIAETRKSGRGVPEKLRPNVHRSYCPRKVLSSGGVQCQSNYISLLRRLQVLCSPDSLSATSRLARKTVSEAQAQAKLQLAHRAGRSNHTKGGRGRSRRN